MSTARTPKVGETVIFMNAHAHPRAAIVTGTKQSLVGERHVTLLDNPLVVHLTVFSPLPRTYAEQSVPHVSMRPRDGRWWAWPDELAEGEL